MTEAEWHASQDPQAMLAFLKEGGLLSPRKARLYGVAVCRRIWHLLFDERSKHAVEASEAFADGLPGLALAEAEDAAFTASQGQFDQSMLSQMGAYRHAAMAAWWVAGDTHLIDAAEVSNRAYGASIFNSHAVDSEEAEQANLLRDIFGPLPFRSVVVDPALLPGVVTSLAEAAYEERELPAGTLPSEKLCVLADALEEAGCIKQEILGHFRSHDAHVRGCWALDLLLKKA